MITRNIIRVLNFGLNSVIYGGAVLAHIERFQLKEKVIGTIKQFDHVLVKETGLMENLLKLIPEELDGIISTAAIAFGSAYVVKKIDEGFVEYRKCQLNGPFQQAAGIRATLQRVIVNNTKRAFKYNAFPLDNYVQEFTRRNDNGHAISGSVRDNATMIMRQFALKSGLDIYEINPSTVTDKGEGDYSHHVAQDLHADLKRTPLSKNHVVAMTDVDYYIEDPDYFAKHNIFMLYSFNPVNVSGIDGDCSFKILANDLVQFNVGNGGSWTHKVWDWAAPGEFIEFTKKKCNMFQRFLGFFGFDNVLYHKVYVWRPWDNMPDRCFIMLTPLFECTINRYFPRDIKCRKLKHVKFSDNARPGWNTITSHNTNLRYEDQKELESRGSTMSISFGRAGDDVCARLDKNDYDLLMGVKTVQTVANRMRIMQYEETRTLPLFLQYYEGTITASQNLATARYMKSVQQSTPVVYMPAEGVDVEPTTTFRKISPSILNEEDLVPNLKSELVFNEVIKKRVTSQRNDVVPPLVYTEYAEEFMNCVLKGVDKHKGLKYDVDTTYEKLDKPTQKALSALLAEAFDLEPKIKISSFIKKEPCKKTPRIISGFGDFLFILKLSAFTLAFRDEVLHNENNSHWFTPGKTPTAIAESIQQYAVSSGALTENDFDNMDGTVSAFLHTIVMSAPILKWVDSRDRDELMTLLNGMIYCKAKSKLFNIKYDPGVGVKSGSPTTCDFNTILAAFIMYCAIRMTEGKMLTPSECFARIGPCFGDDSVFESKYTDKLHLVVKQVGMSIKSANYDEEKGLGFLGRIYIDPYNTITTIQDPVRTLRKIHITGRPKQIPLEVAAYDRLTGYLSSDKLTPIISTYCQMVINYVSNTKVFKSDKKRERRGDKDSEKSYWTRLGEGNSWPQYEKDRPLMFNIIASRLGISTEIVEWYDNELSKLKDPKDLKSLMVAEEFYHSNCVEACGSIGAASLNRNKLMKQGNIFETYNKSESEEDAMFNVRDESRTNDPISLGSDVGGGHAEIASNDVGINNRIGLGLQESDEGGEEIIQENKPAITFNNAGNERLRQEIAPLHTDESDGRGDVEGNSDGGPTRNTGTIARDYSKFPLPTGFGNKQPPESDVLVRNDEGSLRNDVGTKAISGDVRSSTSKVVENQQQGNVDVISKRDDQQGRNMDPPVNDNTWNKIRRKSKSIRMESLRSFSDMHEHRFGNSKEEDANNVERDPQESKPSKTQQQRRGRSQTRRGPNGKHLRGGSNGSRFRKRNGSGNDQNRRVDDERLDSTGGEGKAIQNNMGSFKPSRKPDTGSGNASRNGFGGGKKETASRPQDQPRRKPNSKPTSNNWNKDNGYRKEPVRIQSSLNEKDGTGREQNSRGGERNADKGVARNRTQRHPGPARLSIIANDKTDTGK